MTDRGAFLRLLASSDVSEEALSQWFESSRQFGAEFDRVADAFRWSSGPISERARSLPAAAIAYLESTRPPSSIRAEAMQLDRALDAVSRDIQAVFASTDGAVAALLCLLDPADDGIAGALREQIPEWRALTQGSPTYAAREHDAAATFPLLENVAERTLNRALRALEDDDRRLFPSGDLLTSSTFANHVKTVARLHRRGLLPSVRAALLFLDFAKGGSDSTRRRWTAQGVDLSVHNRASRQILEGNGRIQNFDLVAPYAGLVLSLIESHGTVGQVVRGESTWVALDGVVECLRGAVGDNVTPEDVIDCLHVINVCDTAAVRFDLWSDKLAAAFESLENRMRTALAGNESLASEERRQFDSDEAWLIDRLLKLRARRIRSGEPRSLTETAVHGLDATIRSRLCDRLSNAQIWYGEAATADLRPESQLKLVTMASALVAPKGLHHLNFSPLMSRLNDGSRIADYRVRLLDTVLGSVSFEAILDGRASTGPLVGIATEIGGEQAANIDLTESPEATALLTLLPIYETKSSAAFHRTLKEICDLYDLRKDEFDRVANEAIYLQHMNSARSDKQRMIEWCVPGEIVEVGPGGGVVLDLLEAGFPESRVIGLDISEMVCEALRARKELEGRTWEVVEGDAYELPSHVSAEGATTIVYCSVLHEIYSYVPFPLGADDAKQFQMGAVRDLMRASWRALRPGGRIVIRDGIKPPNGTRRIRFKDPHGPEFLKLFAAQFEGREIEFEWVGENIAELSTPDAMEFLYCYTWGPASFPYEVREQYGIMEYQEYVDALVDWFSDLEGTPKVVELPKGEESYLQPGYIDGLAPKIDLTDGSGQSVQLPDSNCLIVIEKN